MMFFTKKRINLSNRKFIKSNLTINDIKILNNIIGGNSYRIGRVNNKYIAVIGIEDVYLEIDNLKFEDEDKYYDYIELDGNIKNDVLFDVYIYKINHNIRKKINEYFNDKKQEDGPTLKKINKNQ